MPIRKSITIDDKEARRTLQQLEERGGDVSVPLLRFRQYMTVKTDSMFSVLSSAHGKGSHRGVKWSEFAPQYTRKDGTEIPAWGGIKKVRGRGMVKGKLRPSNTRVSKSSALMQDTGNLRGKATTTLFRRTPKRISFGTSPSVNYAAEQQELRPYLFFTVPEDSKALVTEIRQYLWGGLS